MNFLGVCIVTRSSKGVVLKCLESLFAQNMGADMDVVVVDNASTDGTADEISLQYPSVKIVRNSENVGYSRAVNQGLQILKAEYYVLLNPDVIVLEEAILRVVYYMRENPEVGIAIPKVLNVDGTLQYQCRRGEARPWEVFSYFFGLARLLPNDPRFTGYLLNHIDNDRVNEVKAVSGSCMIIRRQVVEQIGYLDELYFAYQEDTDYCFQARKAGWKVYYIPLGRVVHLGGRGGSNVNPYFGIYHWHRSYYLYYRKNLAMDYPFWFHPLYYLAMGVKLLLNLSVAFLVKDKVVGTRKPL